MVWLNFSHRLVGQDYITREHITEVLRREQQEKELLRKQAQEAQQRALVAEQEAKLAKKQANAAYSRVGTFESYLEQFFSHYSQQCNPFPVPFPRPNPATFRGPFRFHGPAAFQAPFTGFISPFLGPNNSCNNCYHPSFPNSTTYPGSSSNYAMPQPDLNKYILQNNPLMSRIPYNNDNNDDSDEEEGAEEDEAAEE